MGTLPHLRYIMEKAGVEKALAFAPTPYWMPKDTYYHLNLKVKNARECHEWLYQSLKGYKDSIYGVIMTDPREKGACKLVEEYVKKGFVGIKVHPALYRMKLDDPAFDDFYSTAERLGVFIVFHTGAHGWRIEQYMPILIDNIAYRHPHLKIILEHIGEPGFFDQAYAVLLNNSKAWENRRVYAGITAITTIVGEARSKEEILSLIKIIGAGRIIYGLDYPHIRPALDRLLKDIKFINGLPLKKKEKEMILGGTLERLIREK